MYAWLLSKEPWADPEELNERLCGLRDVRRNLWRQPNVNEFREWLLDGGRGEDGEDGEEGGRTIEIKSRAEDGLGDSSEEDIGKGRDRSPLGRVFSEEDLSADDFSDDDLYEKELYEDFSEDEKDYALWKNYRRD